MKTRSLLAAVASFLVVGLSGHAQSEKKPKSPAELAADQLEKLMAAADAKPEQATFQKMIDAGLAWLIENPTDRRAPFVVNELGTFGGRLTGKDDAKLRGAYAAQLQYEIVNQKYKPGLAPEAKVALAAADAAASDAMARATFNAENLRAARDKVDALGALPNNGAFLGDAELRFADLLAVGRGPAAAERHLKGLVQNAEPKLAERAQRQLNFLELQRQPFTAKFTTVDGKTIDCAQLRNKAIVLLFWSADDPKARKEIEILKNLYDDAHRSGLEVVAISYDDAEAKDKVLATAKEWKLPFPVIFDGTGKENEIGKKLNIERVPRVAVFDQKGLLVATDQPPSRIVTGVKKMLGIAEERDMSAPKKKSRR